MGISTDEESDCAV